MRRIATAGHSVAITGAGAKTVNCGERATCFQGGTRAVFSQPY
jgi:hypothetical protein